VKPKSNRVFARYRFHQKVQQEGDSFEQILTDLALLAKTVVMVTQMNWFEIVVAGCHSTEIRVKLIQEGSVLTLAKAMTSLELIKFQNLSWKPC